MLCLLILIVLICLPLVLESTDAVYVPFKVTQRVEVIGALLPYSGALHPWLEWGLLAFASLGFLIGFAYAFGEWRGIKGALAETGSPHCTRLLVLGVTSLAVYTVNFLLPFPLHIFYNLRRIGYAGIAGYAVGPAIGTAVAILALFLLYYLAYRVSRGVGDRRMWAIVLIGALFFGLASFGLHIITSPDLYDYIARGRITGVYGGNPYVQTPEMYPDDPIMRQAGWQDTVSAYGPAWEVWAGLIGRSAGNSLWKNVLGHKGLAFASYILGTLSIASILRRVDPERSLSGTLLFAWNPLVLMEGVANAHNDILMMALLLGAFWLLAQVPWAEVCSRQRNRRAWSLMCGSGVMIFVGLAVLTKFVPLLLLPPILLYLLATERNTWLKLGVGLLLMVPMGLVFFEYYSVFWQWPEVLGGLIGRQDLFRMSVASVMKEILQRSVGPVRAQTIVSWPFLVSFGIVYLVVLLRSAVGLRSISSPEEALFWPWDGLLQVVRRLIFGEGQEYRSPWDILTRASLSIVVLYLLLASFWFWPWYLIWPIALLSLSRNERLVIPMTLVACAGQLSHVAWNYVWWWMGITWESLYAINMGVVVALVVPALTAYVIIGVGKRRQLASQG
jgi:hypothetical protein